MTDRNTISKVIESLFEDWIEKNENVHPLAIENMKLLEADALAMLKEQEAEKPIAKEDDTFECCTCGAIVGWDELDASGIVQTRFNYCPFCGRSVKWNA